jgi:serine/threonine-protein phosphatase 4 regulatory subunit 1
VEILPEISKIASEEVKQSQIIQLFDKFSKDNSKWVKMATFQYFGPFIFSFDNLDPNPLLLDYFLSMGRDSTSTIAQVDNDTAFHCAYNFPAVLKTLGPKYWQDKLKPMHDQMVTDMRWKVRRSLAFSIHECAQILGPEITETDLLPVIFHFLQDIVDVAEGALENLP